MASLPPSKCCAVKFDHEGTPTGSLSQVAGLETYVTGDKHGNDKVIVILTDIFGHKLKNTQLVADQLSELSDMKVVIPDILKGEPLNDLSKLGEWIQNHSVEITSPIVKNFLSEFKKTYNVSKLFAVGYCFGAKFTVLNSDKDGLLDAGVIAHPSFIAVEDIEALAKPTLISTGDIDERFTPELREKSVEILSKKKDLRWELCLYSGAPHGFVIKGDLSVPAIKYAKEKSIIDLALWFKSI